MKDQNISMEEVLKLLKEKQKKGDHIHFRVFPKMLGSVPVSELELSQRAEHCIRRTGIETVGDLADKIDGIADLMKIRGSGVKTAKEIMYSLFLYQVSVLSEDRKDAYLQEVLELNRI